jgi:hypothetical protein
MTTYRAAITAVAESHDRRMTAEIFQVVFGFNTGLLLDEVKLHCRTTVVVG